MIGSGQLGRGLQSVTAHSLPIGQDSAPQGGTPSGPSWASSEDCEGQEQRCRSDGALYVAGGWLWEPLAMKAAVLHLGIFYYHTSDLFKNSSDWATTRSVESELPGSGPHL